MNQKETKMFKNRKKIFENFFGLFQNEMTS